MLNQNNKKRLNQKKDTLGLISNFFKNESQPKLPQKTLQLI